MLSKSALTGGDQNRCPPLEAFLELNRGIFSGRFFELTDWGRKRIGGILGAENAIGGGKNRSQSFELTDPGLYTNIRTYTELYTVLTDMTP